VALMDRDEQIKALAKALALTVPAARLVTPQWAATLVDKFGVRVYSELATVGEKPVQVTRENLLQAMKEMPGLEGMAARVEAAVTDDEKADIMAEIVDKHPQEVRQLQDRINALKAS
jgi:hypothetical protein